MIYVIWFAYVHLNIAYGLSSLYLWLESCENYNFIGKEGKISSRKLLYWEFKENNMGSPLPLSLSIFLSLSASVILISFKIQKRHWRQSPNVNKFENPIIISNILNKREIEFALKQDMLQNTLSFSFKSLININGILHSFINEQIDLQRHFYVQIIIQRILWSSNPIIYGTVGCTDFFSFIPKH